MTVSSLFAGAGIALLVLMFLPVLIAILRGGRSPPSSPSSSSWCRSSPSIHPFVGIVIWIVALCVGAFAGGRKVVVVERRG